MGTEFGDLLPAIGALADPGRTVDLAEVASLIGLSPSRAQRVITEAIGESPKNFDRRTRLDLGAVLLLASHERVIDVAFASGFGSHEDFSRSFRRRFGLSPTEWRRTRQNQLTLSQAATATSMSRCATLYHRPLKRKRHPMEYEIELQQLEPVPVMYQSRKVDREDLGATLAEVLPLVFGYVMEHGLTPAGHPFVRQVGMGPALVSIDAGIPLVEAAPDAPPAELEISVGELRGGPAAVTTHAGDYQALGDAYAALERWIEANDHKPAGAPWEVYLTDPGEVPDPTDWRTLVCWPVAP